MGCWGMGITQSDEFSEIYDRFMERYNNGDEVSAITEGILEEYHNEFSDDDGIMHDVYFALAKAEWMCCAQSKKILDRVKEIIESGANIIFYRELEATEKDLKIRQKNLEKFWTSLRTPRKTPKKRNPPPKGRQLPPANIGDVFSYKGEVALRVMVVLDSWDKTHCVEGYFCCIFDKEFQHKPTVAELVTETIGQIGIYDAEAFLPASQIHLIGSFEIPPNKYEELFGNSILLGGREDFYTSKGTKQVMTLEELLNAKNMSIFNFSL